MKLFLALMLVSSMALAIYPSEVNNHGYGGTGSANSTANPTANANGGDSRSESGSNSASSVGDSVSHGGSATTGESVSTSGSYSQGSDSASNVDSQNTATNTAQGGSNATNVRVIENHDEVANTVPSLNLAHCSDGVGAANKSASINTGSVNYICEASRAMGLVLTTIPRETPEEVEKSLEMAKEIKEDVGWYMKIRKFTAPIGAVLRDVWPIILMAVVI